MNNNLFTYRHCFCNNAKDAAKCNKRVAPSVRNCTMTAQIDIMKQQMLMNPKEYMKVIDPQCSCNGKHVDNCIIILLSDIGKILLAKRTQEYFSNTINDCLSKNLLDDEASGNELGIRMIQKDRFEIWIQATNKGTSVFDWVCNKLITTRAAAWKGYNEERIKNMIISYATEQAAKDNRLQTISLLMGVLERKDSSHLRTPNYDNYSFIVSYGDVPQQVPHIDSVYPNFQYAMYFGDNTPPTRLFFPESLITDVTSLISSNWDEEKLPFNMKQLPSDFKAHMDRRPPDFHDNLYNYGNVLSPVLKDVTPNVAGKIKTGTVTALPGSVIHAGPHCQDSRCVLFFSGYPKMCQLPLLPKYDADKQLSAPLLMAQILLDVWGHLRYTSEKKLMLWKLKQLIEDTKCYDVHKHFLPTQFLFREFLQKVIALKSDDDLLKFTEKLQENKFLFFEKHKTRGRPRVQFNFNIWDFSTFGVSQYYIMFEITRYTMYDILLFTMYHRKYSIIYDMIQYIIYDVIYYIVYEIWLHMTYDMLHYVI
jgi:hypothetical protein